MTIPPINRYELVFPDPSGASPEGIVAFGGDLNPSRLLLAYRKGIFPWYAKGDPILWWSPDPRLILELDDFKLRRSLKKRLPRFEIRFDTAFEAVMRRCASKARPGQRGSWILEEVIEAYTELFELGCAHSVEAYLEGVLVGGLYGVSVGRVFCGESMFADVSDASKAALAALVEKLRLWGYDFIDCQVPTEHLKSLGAVEIPRREFLMRLEAAVHDDDAWGRGEKG
jgi:leucyl/phenylalanyl-tRNA---protein transferase